MLVIVVALMCIQTGCRQIAEKVSVRPRSLRDVPAARLAFRFETDTSADALPDSLKAEDVNEKLAPVQTDFDQRRKEDALLRTVVSPDGMRALALYATSDTPQGEFRLDMYSADGMFLRNILPPELSGAFSTAVVWSSDSQQIAFIGRKGLTSQPTPTPPDFITPPNAGLEDNSATQTPTPATPMPSGPVIAPVPVFNTEQVYLCDRDGFNLRPLTTRAGLIYFHVTWAPDGHALAALACKEDEWASREKEGRLPAGRPRLIWTDGRERLLDDRLTDVLPAWSPDSSKVATAFDTDVEIYDALTESPTGARIPLRESLLTASVQYDENKLPKSAPVSAKGKTTETASAPQTNSLPISFNPVVRLEWFQPETLFVQTGFVRIYSSLPENKYMRWHTLHLSPQAAVLS